MWHLQPLMSLCQLIHVIHLFYSVFFCAFCWVKLMCLALINRFLLAELGRHRRIGPMWLWHSPSLAPCPRWPSVRPPIVHRFPIWPVYPWVAVIFDWRQRLAPIPCRVIIRGLKAQLRMSDKRRPDSGMFNLFHPIGSVLEASGRRWLMTYCSRLTGVVSRWNVCQWKKPAKFVIFLDRISCLVLILFPKVVAEDGAVRRIILRVSYSRSCTICTQLYKVVDYHAN